MKVASAGDDNGVLGFNPSRRRWSGVSGMSANSSAGRSSRDTGSQRL